MLILEKKHVTVSICFFHPFTGYVPVLNAEVTASVSAPGGDLQPFLVTDDGLGADIQKNDGIYSAFLTEFKGEGRLWLKCM